MQILEIYGKTLISPPMKIDCDYLNLNPNKLFKNNKENYFLIERVVSN